MKTFVDYINEGMIKGDTDVEMHVEKSKVFFWPDIDKFDIIDTSGCDKFGTCTTVMYQHYDSGVIIDVMATNIKLDAKKKLSAKYNFEMNHFGMIKKMSTHGGNESINKGLMGSVANLKSYAKEVENKLKKALKGWSVDFDQSGDIELGKDLGHGYYLTAYIWDAFSDMAECDFRVTENGGYEQQIITSKKMRLQGASIQKIKSTVLKYEKEVVKRHLKRFN